MNINEPVVFIVDDEEAIRDSLTLMIAQEKIAVKAFENAESFLEACHPELFGCAIIDVRMPGMDGLQLQEVLCKRNIPLPVIFLTGHGDIPMSVKAMKAGAMDFLTKPVTRDKLLTSIRTAIAASEKLLTEHVCLAQAQAHLASLTERERDVMLLAIKGYQNKEIARQLDISHRTVEIHKSKIMHKMKVPNLLDLAKIAQGCGLE